MLKQRLILGPIMIAIAFGLVALDDYLHARTGYKGLAFGAGMSFIIAMTAWELARILKANDVNVTKPLSMLTGVVGLLGTTLLSDEPRAFGTLAILIMILSLLTHIRDKTIEGVVAAAGGTMLVFVYLGAQASFWLMLSIERSAWVVLWLVLTTKSCDIGAYFTGRAIGKHKLVPWLSPGKTWEGLIGGVITSSIVCLIGAYWLSAANVPTDIPLLMALGMGAVIGVLGQLGDLTASLFKRDAGRKDSSASIPGFGGWLDVIDSLLLVGPFAYWMLRGLAATT